MAKGFTVKAKSPMVKKAPEWDYDAAKAMMKGKTVVFCLPGRGVSYTFLKNFVQLCFDLVQNGVLEKLVLAVRQSILLEKPLDPLSILKRLRYQQPLKSI